VTIHAQLQTVEHFELTHITDPRRVRDLMAHLEARGDVPPILAVQDIGNGARVLDGNHRAQAARKLNRPLEAWVISQTDFESLIHAEFSGEIPSRLADLDDYILCDGRPYSDHGRRQAAGKDLT
jgi:ParB-like chromosome segregation protein Spo0J